MNGHRKTVKRFHEPGDCHELTFSCYRRMQLLTNDAWRRLLAESLDRAVEGHSCRLIAYVFMPEHVHILVQPMVVDARIDPLLKAIKAPFSVRIRRRLEEADSPLLERLTVRERRVALVSISGCHWSYPTGVFVPSNRSTYGGSSDVPLFLRLPLFPGLV